ncbi:MAG: tail fiber domain-containing protein [Beijerinckiaceae bacterium]
MTITFRSITTRAAVVAFAGLTLAACVPAGDPYYYGAGPVRGPRFYPSRVVEVDEVYARPRRTVYYSSPRVERPRPVFAREGQRFEGRPSVRRPRPVDVAQPRVAPVQVGRDPALGEGRGGGGGGGGGSGGGDGGGGGGWSDIRLKQNIERVGTTASGLPLYAFDYIWGGPRQVGVMAQDVMQQTPDAVIETASGYFKVDYDQIGVRMQSYETWRNAGAKVTPAQ